MRAILSLLLLVLISVVVAACASGPKSSTVLSDGDAPSIHYTNREAAGGPTGTRRYR